MKNVSKLSVFVGAVLTLIVAGGVDGGQLSVAATALGCAAAIALMTCGAISLSQEGRRGA
ncbi:MAG: hypothetical protein LUG52_04020 [Clostridia bacterium]|nr:hypothetical protein [Clostridia bacterium]